jgi:hypothetical protein
MCQNCPSEKIRVSGGRESCCFGQKLPHEKGSVRRCLIVMQQPVILPPKFGANFYTFAVKSHSSMRNWLFGLPIWILCERSPWCHRKLSACSWLCCSPVSLFSVSVNLDFPCTDHAFFPNSCLIIARISFALFPRFAQNWCCSFVGSIAKSHQARYTTANKRRLKISTSTQQREYLYTDSQDIRILSSTVASRYYNCCTDGQCFFVKQNGAGTHILLIFY